LERAHGHGDLTPTERGSVMPLGALACKVTS
jgi:hypothetical protein